MCHTIHDALCDFLPLQDVRITSLTLQQICEIRKCLKQICTFYMVQVNVPLLRDRKNMFEEGLPNTSVLIKKEIIDMPAWSKESYPLCRLKESKVEKKDYIILQICGKARGSHPVIQAVGYWLIKSSWISNKRPAYLVCQSEALNAGASIGQICRKWIHNF